MTRLEGWMLGVIGASIVGMGIMTATAPPLPITRPAAITGPSPAQQKEAFKRDQDREMQRLMQEDRDAVQMDREAQRDRVFDRCIDNAEGTYDDCKAKARR
jgi:hypothetical protein